MSAKKPEEILTLKDAHLGPAIIGQAQHEANQRIIAQQGKHGQGLGPLVVMTRDESIAWFDAGKPEAWQGWLEKYRDEQKADAEDPAPKKKRA